MYPCIKYCVLNVLCIPVSYIMFSMYPCIIYCVLNVASLYPILCSLYICIVLSGLDSSPRPWVGSNLYNPYVSLCSIDPNHIKQGRERPPPFLLLSTARPQMGEGSGRGGGELQIFLDMELNEHILTYLHFVDFLVDLKALTEKQGKRRLYQIHIVFAMFD